MAKKTKPGKTSREKKAARELELDRAQRFQKRKKARIITSLAITGALAIGGLAYQLFKPEPQIPIEPETRGIQVPTPDNSRNFRLNKVETIIPAKNSEMVAHIFLQQHPLDGVFYETNSLNCQGAIYRELEQLYKQEKLGAVFDEGFGIDQDLAAMVRRETAGLSITPGQERRRYSKDQALAEDLVEYTSGGARLFFTAYRDAGVYPGGWEPFTAEQELERKEKRKELAYISSRYNMAQGMIERGKITEDDQRFIDLKKEFDQLWKEKLEETNYRTRQGFLGPYELSKQRGDQDFAIIMGEGHLLDAESQLLEEGFSVQVNDVLSNPETAMQAYMPQYIQSLDSHPEVRFYFCPMITTIEEVQESYGQYKREILNQQLLEMFTQ